MRAINVAPPRTSYTHAKIDVLHTIQLILSIELISEKVGDELVTQVRDILCSWGHV